MLLNFFSFFYTKNDYYTNVAVTMHVTSLLFMYFLSLHLSGRTAFWLLVLTALSGVLVSIETWFEFYDKSVLFQWMTPGSMVIGTIGNSNYLGAYLLFPLLAFTALIFLLKGKLRGWPVPSGSSCSRLSSFQEPGRHGSAWPPLCRALFFLS